MIAQSLYYKQDFTPKKFKVSFGGGTLAPPSDWNEYIYNTPLEELFDENGNIEPIKIGANYWAGVGTDNVSTGSDSGAVPDLVMRDNIYTFAGGDIYFYRLSQYFEYWFRIFATAKSAGGLTSFKAYKGFVQNHTLETGDVLTGAYEITTYSGGVSNTQNVINTEADKSSSQLVDLENELTIAAVNGTPVSTLNSIELNKTPIADSNFDGQILKFRHYYEYSSALYAIESYNYFPTNYSKRRKVSLVIYLSGGGEMTGASSEVLLQGLGLRLDSGSNQEFVCMMPFHSGLVGGVANSRWQPEQIKGLIDSAIRDFKIDTNRIYITGLSTGGNGVWRCLISPLTKNYFCSALIACGITNQIFDGNDRDLTLEAADVVDIPIKVYHNTSDPQVTYDNSTDMLAAIETAQPSRVNSVILISPVSSSHDAWTGMYADTSNYGFLQTYSL